MSAQQSFNEQTITLPLSEYHSLLAEHEELKAQLAELRRLVFGRKSERFIPAADGQTSLFEAEDEHGEDVEQPTTQRVSYDREVRTKEKQKPVRALLPAHLPREEELIEPADWEEGMKKIGEEVTEILEHIPGRLYVRRIVRPKYVKGKEDGVKVASLPSLPLPKSNAGPGLLACIQVNKWVDHLPFYRQIAMFKREGVTLSDSTFNSWFNATARLVEPLYEALVKEVQSQDYLQADETPIRVQDHHQQEGTHQGYHWVYHAPKAKLVAFDYQPSRSRAGPAHFLRPFKGYLQTDGYVAYDELDKGGEITRLACMAHARRYFEKALQNDRKRAEHALGVIQSLYAVERKAKEDPKFDLLTLRQQKAVPILKEWKKWLDKQQSQLTPKSSIGTAVNYTLNLWNRLIRYTQDAELLIDNNLIENTIRPLAIGRKNYLFAGSHDAAQRAAMFYSFFATCKLHEVNPYLWLKDVLERIMDTPVNKVDRLLPHKWKENPQSPQV